MVLTQFVVILQEEQSTMELIFHKYQGTGNDFVILDNRDERYNELTNEQVRFLCNRRFGIGADGLMLLNNANGFDFEMKYYNADGRESTMCGNGGRCLVKFAYNIGIRKRKISALLPLTVRMMPKLTMTASLALK